MKVKKGDASYPDLVRRFAAPNGVALKRSRKQTPWRIVGVTSDIGRIYIVLT